MQRIYIEYTYLKFYRIAFFNRLITYGFMEHVKVPR